MCFSGEQAASGVLQVVDLVAAEHSWEISPGVVAHDYAFNGQAPGPIIEARVGDTLLVRFTNLLPEATTIRWHNLEKRVVPNGSGPALDPVPPGGRVQYRIHLPAAGTFLYRSTHLGATQTHRGLSGVLVVRRPGEQPYDAEQVLLIDDSELDRPGQLPPQLRSRSSGRRPSEEVLLVNGTVEPEIQIATGQVERWRLVNATVARRLQLSLRGHRFHLIEATGRAHTPADEVLIDPGDRLDLAVGPFDDGETVELQVLIRGRGRSRHPHHRLATLKVTPRRPTWS